MATESTPSAQLRLYLSLQPIVGLPLGRLVQVRRDSMGDREHNEIALALWERHVRLWLAERGIAVHWKHGIGWWVEDISGPVASKIFLTLAEANVAAARASEDSNPDEATCPLCVGGIATWSPGPYDSSSGCCTCKAGEGLRKQAAYWLSRMAAEGME